MEHRSPVVTDSVQPGPEGADSTVAGLAPWDANPCAFCSASVFDWVSTIRGCALSKRYARRRWHGTRTGAGRLRRRSGLSVGSTMISCQRSIGTWLIISNEPQPLWSLMISSKSVGVPRAEEVLEVHILTCFTPISRLHTNQTGYLEHRLLLTHAAIRNACRGVDSFGPSRVEIVAQW